MKYSIRKKLAFIAFAGLVTASWSVAFPSCAYAAYADETSYVDQGTCPDIPSTNHSQHTPYHAAINVVDDDGTVFTFEYHIPWAAEAFYRIYGQSEWHEWPEPGSATTHLDDLAAIGFQAVRQLTSRF